MNTENPVDRSVSLAISLPCLEDNSKPPPAAKSLSETIGANTQTSRMRIDNETQRICCVSRKVYLLWLHGIIIPSEMPFQALIKPSVQSLMEVCFYNEQQALSYLIRPVRLTVQKISSQAEVLTPSSTGRLRERCPCCSFKH